jgi:hypothetical protein
MLRKLFRGRDRLASPDAQVRREAVLALDAAAAASCRDALAELLGSDPDRGVRLACIERLDSIDALATVLDDDTVADAAARRIVTLARSRGSEPPGHPRLLALGLLDASADERASRLARIDDPEQLAVLALKTRGELRDAILAHPAMQRLAALTLLEKRSRGTDKSLNRVAREALERIRRAQQHAESARRRATELAEALARPVALRDRAGFERARSLYEAFEAAVAAHEQARQALLAHGETLPDLAALRGRVRPPQPPPVEPAAAISQDAVPAPVVPAEVRAAEPPVAAPEDSAQAVAALRRRAEHEAREAARREAATRVRNALDALEAALEGGSVSHATAHLTEARKHLEGLAGPPPRELAARLKRLSAALAELRDWQTFATTPKREALCAAVQALTDHPIAPGDQAARLKSLRQEWQTLGPITSARDARLAERFNALAERAFEPCRQWFAEQAELRRRNLESRERLCNELDRYVSGTDWARADMRAAEQIMRTARAEWRRCQPVERGPGRAVEARFEALQQTLHERIRTEWERNVRAKTAIVAEAEALASGASDVELQIREVKALQQRWRAVGITPRGKDRELWTAFRRACDAVFTSREAARAAHRTGLDEVAARCSAALDAFETELAATRPESATDAQTRVLRDRLAGLDGLPPALRQPLAGRRRDLLARHQALLESKTALARRGRLEALRRWDEAVTEAETARRASGGTEALDLPDPCFAPRATRVRADVPLDALRRLTLRAEQAAGIASPPEDAALRLEVQVERLRAGFAGGRRDDPLELAESWCALGPKDAAVDALRMRFFAAVGRLAD